MQYIFQQTSIFLIRMYQFFSPFLNRILITVFGFHFVCHQKPSCSEYTIAQIRQHGTILGLSRGFRRVYYCRG